MLKNQTKGVFITYDINFLRKKKQVVTKYHVTTCFIKKITSCQACHPYRQA